MIFFVVVVVACFGRKHVLHVLSMDSLVSVSQFNIVLLQAVLTQIKVYSVIEYAILASAQ